MTQQICACGCGRPLPSHGGKGRPNKYFSGACRVRAHRKKDTAPTTSTDVTKIPKDVTKIDTMKHLSAPSALKSVLKYPGSKWAQAHWIISFFPQHRTYVEPYFGGGAVFFTMKPSEYEVINDKSGSVINLFKVIREHGDELAQAIEYTPWSREEYYAAYALSGDEIEDARRFLVRCWQAHGTRLNQRTGWRNRGSADVYHVLMESAP